MSVANDDFSEKIIQTGKKKLVLDHLIVQKMDDEEDSGEVQSILMFGAKALFEEEGSEATRDITCGNLFNLSPIMRLTVY